MAESEEELKSFLRRVKEESEDAGLTLNIQKTKIMASGPNASRQIEEEKVETDSWAPKSLWMVTAALKLKDASSWKKSYDRSRQHIKKLRHHFVDKGPHSQSYHFSSSRV